MFNDYIWRTYLGGTGKEVVNFFEENLSNNFSKEYADKICEFHRAYCPSKVVNESLHSELVDAYEDIAEGIWFLEEGEYSIESAISYIFNGFLNEDGATPQKVFNFFSGSVAFFTTLFARELPELFIPYYFTLNFNIFEKIAQEFEIILPEIPIKKDYEGRFLYYGKICEALYDFREKHNMSAYELCAFLYDFAPKYVGGAKSYIIKDIPAPKSAYFIGGSKNDAFLLSDDDTITPWQCNPDTMVGDAIVMYLKSPISAVDSIWRSVSIGFNDPFFYYYRCTYIANPCKVNRISQKQLEGDSVFGKLPIVKKNMQGLNGVELSPSVYNHLLDMTESDLPRLEFAINNDDLVLSREKDVENKLIKPFLAELGYTEKDYKQQLYIEIGNHNHALIPDFVINPIVSKGHQSADFLVEAKYSISSNKLLEEAKTQARGYAKLLNAKYSVIAAKEGVWITDVADDYTASVLSFSWSDLKNEDNFHKVYNIIGRGKF
ncbi:MAG: hypothetical protein IJP16_07170 [Clostridia bacterium]|nr:hypothetical protein [Clostridia bacterium]